MGRWRAILLQNPPRLETEEGPDRPESAEPGPSVPNDGERGRTATYHARPIPL